jgi:nucleotide-binding universal stress UspA family protein
VCARSVPADGSEVSNAAWPHALEFADRYGARLDVVIVIDDHVRFIEEGSDVAEGAKMRAQARDNATRLVRRLVNEARERDVDSQSSVIEHSSPGEALFEYVEDEGIEAVAMGTHGRTGLRRVVVGSVAEHVARNAEVPVLIVPLGSDHA